VIVGHVCPFLPNGVIFTSNAINTMNVEQLNQYFKNQDIPLVRSTFDLIDLGRRGISKKAVLGLAKGLAMTTAELLVVLHVSERTWQRYADDKLLPQDMTERALQLATLYQQGEEIFGQADKFKGWMAYPNPVFGGKRPIELLDSIYGFRVIEEELIRIDYGVLA
jgi:putative toxin-antitoxin system antitoxin component (TIGR02293 family)